MIPVQRPVLGAAEARAAAEAVESGWVAQGPRVARFEAEFAARAGAAHGVAVTSCTTALHLGLLALGIGPGDEVVVPSLSFVATTSAAVYVGARPVFADVDPLTANLTWDTIEAVLSPRTRAVIVVHQAGVPADIEPIRERCAEHGVAVLEDAACAIGATYRGSPAGTGARLAAWSFHPRKVITTGEGGMLTTDDAELAARLRRLREHGMDVSAADRHAAGSVVLERYLELGFNYRMTDVQAAIGLVQLGRLEEIVTRRRALAQRYHDLLAPLPGVRAVTDPPYGTTNYQSYWVVLPEEFPLGRNDLLALLHARGVSARRGIMAAHLEPVYANLDHVPLPATEHLTQTSLILPLFHEITEDEQAVVVGALFDAAEGRGAA